MSNGKPATSGRPKIELDLAEVERLAGLGLTQAEIAFSLGISEDTITRRKGDSADFADAIKRGRTAAHSEVSSQLFQQCKKGNVAAIIWYEKTRRGMSDKVNVSITELDNAIERELALLSGREEAGDAEAASSEAIH
jgi:hypothetical protein